MRTLSKTLAICLGCSGLYSRTCIVTAAVAIRYNVYDKETPMQYSGGEYLLMR